MEENIHNSTINIHGKVIGKNQIAIKIDSRKYGCVPSDLKSTILENSANSENAKELLDELKSYMDNQKKPSKFDRVIIFLKGLGEAVLKPLTMALLQILGASGLELLFGN